MTRWIVTTDGSALGNPGYAGWAWVVSEHEWGSGNAQKATNNQMELRAVLEALKQAPEDTEVLVRSDSRYAIDCLTKWVHGWRKRGWKTADGKDVANRELIEEILLHMGRNRVRFEWVRGHDGDEWNEQADAKARSAATRASRGEIGQWGSARRR
jgi:ribonuclease HI